jgi:acyl carrier protein
VNTLERIQALAVKELQVDLASLSPETRLDQIGIDSLSLIEFLFLLEDEFHVRFPEDKNEMQSVNDLVLFLDRAERGQRLGAA